MIFFWKYILSQEWLLDSEIYTDNMTESTVGEKDFTWGFLQRKCHHDLCPPTETEVKMGCLLPSHLKRKDLRLITRITSTWWPVIYFARDCGASWDMRLSQNWESLGQNKRIWSLSNWTLELRKSSWHQYLSHDIALPSHRARVNLFSKSPEL